MRWPFATLISRYGKGTVLSDIDAYHELCAYTLAHGDPIFIHQLVVDAFTAQHAEDFKPIGAVFSLLGLYLHVEHGFTGKQVQRAHMQLARVRRTWQPIMVPAERGAITVYEVLAVAPGPARDAAIERWCKSVWQACLSCRPMVAAVAERELGVAAAPMSR
jgi:hypothetical protein